MPTTRPSLTTLALSRVFVGVLAHALGEERHFALIESIHATNQYQGSLVIVRAALRSVPTISPVTTAIMITTSNSLL